MDEERENYSSSIMAVDSISFGRFASDSLAWEKWSSFSHNRHMEEVEKYSVPGSVAQKKAFFEAYYKRKRSQIAAESVDTEGERIPSDNVENCDAEYTVGGDIIESENAAVHKVEQGLESVEVNINEIVNRSVSCNELKYSMIVGVDEEVSNGENTTEILCDGSKTSPEAFENQNQTADVELQKSEKAGKPPLKESFDFNKDAAVADQPKKKSSNASPHKPQTNSAVGRPKKRNASPAKPSQSPVAFAKKENNATPNGNCFASCTPNIKNKTPRSKNIGADMPSVRETAAPAKRLHMSLSLSSGRACETTPVYKRSSTTTEKLGKLKGASTSFRSPECSVSEPNRPSTKEPTNTNSTSSATEANPLESRSPLKFSCFSGIRASCKNLSASFKLRTEERAAKRKEFFLKLQEKAKAEEAEKMQNQKKNKLPLPNALKFKLGKENEPGTGLDDTNSRTRSRRPSIKSCYAKITRKQQ